MTSLFANVAHHLRRLASFQGRESRGEFWPYAAVVIVIAMLAWLVVFMPWFAESMQRMQAYASAHPEQATVESGPGQYSITIQGSHPDLFPDMSGIMAGLSIIALVVVLLLGTAVARRLHDRGRRGAWGLLPLPFLAAGTVVMPSVMESPAPNMGLFFGLFLNNMIYLASLVVLIVMLAGESQRGLNRYDTGL